MKKYIIILSMLFLIGCSSTYELTLEDHKRMEDEVDRQREIDDRVNRRDLR